MTITLPPDQVAWIEAPVATGDHSDVDEVVRTLLATGVAEHEEVGDDDIAWAKPLVDEALAAIERGDTITLQEFEAHLDVKFGALGD